MTLKVGDEGLVRGYGKTTPAKVVKVGRKWATVEPAWLGKFDIETGRSNHTVGTGSYFLTMEMEAHRERVIEANEVIRSHGLRFEIASKWSDTDRFALAQWLTERFGEAS